jgi:protein-disulfide isomerase
MKKKNNNQLFVISVCVGIIVIMGALFFVSKLQDKQAAQEFPKITGENKVKVNGFNINEQPTLGNKKSGVEVVEFGDYKCPVCAQWNDKVFPKIQSDYINTNQISFSFENYPFISKDSNLAALAGEVIYSYDPNAFWTFHHEIYRNQPEETKTWATKKYLTDLAKKVIPNLNEQKFQDDLYKKSTMEKVATDMAIGDHFNVQGTPTVFVNGKMLKDPSYDSIKAAIEEAKASIGK